MTDDLLIEIGTEELPPRALASLSASFAANIADGVHDAGFVTGEVKAYSSPRRLAVIISDVEETQPDREVERKGPNLKAAFDDAGEPTKAVIGFARSCGVEIDQLSRQETDKGVWLVFHATEKGKDIKDLIQDIIIKAIQQLPIPKRMRWGSRQAEFVRPAHWLVVMHGSRVLDAKVLELESGNTTRGHRFHANMDIEISEANKYPETLKEKGFVLADSDERSQMIRDQVERAAEKIGGIAVIDEDLLDEVTALNEWPTAIAGEFDRSFLEVPAEALIKTMQDNQKYFPIVDKDGQLMNFFITISNIESRDVQTVKEGNERVIRPRLADAKFFWEQDLKNPLSSLTASLDEVVFQSKLGSIGDKIRRVENLSEEIARSLGEDEKIARRAAHLSKSDLMTNMVGEFASLQGVMGMLYARASGEPEEVAIAIDEQYMPKGAGSETATTASGQILSISDKLDTLVGIFSIGQKPTGEKDPFALRRAALGILRTVIERELDVNLMELISIAAQQYKDISDEVIEDVFDYMLERLRAYYHDRGIATDIYDAVNSLRPERPLDFDKRIHAVTAFRKMKEAESLAAANKRVSNILKRADVNDDATVDEDLLQEDPEKILFDRLVELEKVVGPLLADGAYEESLKQMSTLQKPVDDFFDNVMVNAEDVALKNNRTALLKLMSDMFIQVADLSRLQ